MDILYEVDRPASVGTTNRPASLDASTQLMLAEVRHAPVAAELEAQ